MAKISSCNCSLSCLGNMVLLCCVFKGLPRCLNESTMARFSFVSHKGFSLTWLLSQTQAGNPKITEKLISRYGDVFTHIWYPHCQSLNCDWRIIAPPPTPGFQYTGDAKTPDHVIKTADGAEHAVLSQWYHQPKLTAPGIERPATLPARDNGWKNDKYSNDGWGGGVVLHVCSQEV